MGDCRILICTEGAGMGVDVPDVVCVIQWTISHQLNISNFWQRARHAGRNRNLSSVAILFYHKMQRIVNSSQATQDDEAISHYQEPSFGHRSRLVLQQVQGFGFAGSGSGGAQLGRANGSQNSGFTRENEGPNTETESRNDQNGNIDHDLMPPPGSSLLPVPLRSLDRGLL